MSDSPPPDDSIDDEIMTFDETLPNMEDDFPDDDFPDDGPPDDEFPDDGPPDDIMEGPDDDGPPDGDFIDDDPSGDGPHISGNESDNDPSDMDDDDDDLPGDSFDDGPPGEDKLPDDMEDMDDDMNIDDDDDDDNGPPDENLPPNDDSMTLPEDDESTLPPPGDSSVNDDLPPSDNESVNPPPSPSVSNSVHEDDNDTFDGDTNSIKKAKHMSRKDRDSKIGSQKGQRTSILSDGLDSKLTKMSASSLASIDDPNDEEEDEDEDEDEETVESNASPQAGRNVDYSEPTHVESKGTSYIFIQGKFEGDEFEELMVKVESNIFFVKTPVDETVIIPFDLGIDTKAKRDVVDDCKFYLNQKGQLITFQANSAKVVNDLFIKFPKDTIVLEFEFIREMSSTDSSIMSSLSKNKMSVEDDGDGDGDGDGEASVGSLSDIASIVKKIPQEKENKIVNKKDTTFNKIDIDDPSFDIDDYDIDDNGALVRKQGNAKKKNIANDKVSSPVAKSSAAGRTMLSPTKHQLSSELDTSLQENIKGHSKRDIITAKLMKPKFSVRRMKQICNWVSSLGIWHNPVTIVTLHSEFCNGILLAKLAKLLIPTAQFSINTRALTEKAAISNLESSLGVFWRTKCVNNNRIASAAEIYNGNINKTVITLQEIFEVYVVQPLFAQAPKMFRWYNNILKQYHTPIPEAIFRDGDLIDLWSYVQSGFVIFCLIHHLYGPVTVGEGVDMVRIDAKRIVSKPLNVNDYRENIKYLFLLLKAIKIPCLYELDDWLTYPDTEFIVYQLFVIYETLKTRQCSLPPAQGVNAGVTSGPNGDPIVTGMVFKDTLLKGQKVSTLKKKPLGVFLGGGGDSIQLLPIDTSGDTSTVYRMVCPLGLMSTKVKIVHANVKAKEEKSNVARKTWDQSVSVELVKSEQSQRKIDILKQTHTPAKALLVAPRVTSVDNVVSGVSNMTMSDESNTVGNSKESKKISPEQLSVEVEKLESAMEESQQDMEELEEELAVKYLELEHESDRLGDIEYNSRFSFLEKERAALERERTKLQDFFSQQLSHLHEKSSSGGGESPTKQSKKDVNLSFYAATTQGRATSIVKKKKLNERGWNQFVRNESHNNVFKTKNQNSGSTSFLSPTKHSTYNNEKDKTMSNHKFTLEPPPKVKLSKDEVWTNFKGKLRSANIKWMSTKSRTRGNKIQELLTPKAPLEMKRTVEFNSVPKIQVQRKVDDVIYMPGTPAYIRKRELELMKLEEARRWMVIQREEMEEAMHLSNLSQEPPPPPPPTSPSPVSSPFLNRTPYKPMQPQEHQTPLLNTLASPISKRQTPSTQTPYASTQMPFFSPSPFSLTTPMSELRELRSNRQLASTQDFEATLSWLKFPRTVSLKDRNSQHSYLWTIEEEEMKGEEVFVIKWYRIDNDSQDDRNNTKLSSGQTNHEQLEGFVICQDIITAQILSKAPSQLVLRLSSSPRSLKSSGGRTMLTMAFASPTECAKYCDGLNQLLHSSFEGEE